MQGPFKIHSYFATFLLFALIALSSCHKNEPVNNASARWYKNELIYNLDVKAFKDSDGDGLGDFKGLESELDYLKWLGVTTIWLAPFQPSPWLDDGYDITDYYTVDKRLGSHADFVSFMEAAKKKKIHVIMDMVINHSSTQHPWFLASRDSTSDKREWYLWSKKRPDDWNKGMGFPHVEKETWRYNPKAKAYYFHRFYNFEPDLNFQNPKVLAEANRITTYWLDQGMDGFRFDAVPFIIDDPRKSSEHPEHDFNLLHQLVGTIKAKKPDAVLLGEANVSPEENKDYLSKKNDGLDMMLNFPVNEYLFYAFATGHAGPFKDALNATAKKPAQDQWGYFLRNHDEIDLGKLNGHQFKEACDAFGPDTNMQLYGRGIRRRLASMFNNNQNKLRFAYSVLFGLPGTPIIRYGEEIGMGDDLSLKERLSVRTPMQWSNKANGGFSTAKQTFRPVITQGDYGIQGVNVAAEQRDSSSLLNFIRKMAALRKRYPVIGDGVWKIIDQGNDHVFAVLYESNSTQILLCYNFDGHPAKVKLNSVQSADKVINLINNKSEQVKQNNAMVFNLDGYGYKWLKLK
jgi:maltose alpha-D-glucosyltransferase/alpha-amylase